MSTARRTEAHTKLRKNSAISRACCGTQFWSNPGTRSGTRFGTDSGTKSGGRLQGVVLSCDVSDPGGAAAARLFRRITLDPLLGSTQVYRVFSATFPFWSTGVYL
jgi:hypothetical protein